MSATFDASALRDFLPNIPVILGLFAPDGTVIGGTFEAANQVNEEASVLFQGRNVVDLAPGTGPLIAATVAQIAATGEMVEDQYIPWAVGDGVTELWRYSYFPLRGEDNAIESVGVVMEEVGEQERVRTRLQSFEALVEQASELVAVATLDTRLLYMNAAGRRLVGHGPDDALLQYSGEYSAPESLPHRDGVLAAAAEGTWRGRLYLKHVVTGESIPVDATAFVVRDELSGTPMFRAAVMRDARSNERLLRRLEQQIERMPVAIVMTSAAGEVRRWNPAAERLFGYSEDAALGLPVHELVGTPELRALVGAGTTSEGTVLAGTTAAGELRMVEWSIAAIDDDQSPGDIMLIGHDLTAQRRAEEERREALRIAAMATWSVDLTHGGMTWSDELYELAGVDQETFTPNFLSCWSLLEHSERRRARRLKRRIAAIPQFRFTFEIVRPSDGVPRWLEVEGHRLVDGERMIGTARDVTMQRRAADRLRELDMQRRQLLERMLLSEEEERGRIARALHDDTVQLMAALQLNLDRIQMVLGGEPPAATTLVSETRAALSDALERTRHLMFELRPQRFDRHGLDDAITALCEQVGVEAGFEVVIDIPDTRYEGVIEDLCYRTVREAVINARKHSGADHLWVTLTSSGGSVHGVVRDDGKGFDPHSRDRAFMRLHMGIDAMAERIRLAGGTCEITSEPGAGCLVSFSVPVPEVSAERWDGVV